MLSGIDEMPGSGTHELGEDSHIESKPPSQETSAMKHTPAHIAIQAPEYKAVKQVIAVNLVAHG